MTDETILNPALLPETDNQAEQSSGAPEGISGETEKSSGAPEGALSGDAETPPTVSTEVNEEIIAERNRRSGLEDLGGQALHEPVAEGILLLNKYTVKKQLEVASGEADLYLCRYQRKDYIAKIYHRKFALKQEVAEKIMSIRSPYVAQLIEIGDYQGYPVEILPFYEKGSLQGKRFSPEELKERVIPAINEGLKALHDEGIIHKDLKPSNIMINDDGKTFSIIDFGISSAVADNQTILITETGMTPEYSAPETFRNIFYEGSDYYSFGITLFELLNGYTPYANMRAQEIEQYVSLQRIPFPEDMPADFRDLISALTYYDISYRKNKDNPNRRWTYEEVRQWLDGVRLVIPGEGAWMAAAREMPPYSFQGETYTDPASLVSALARNWEEGKRQFFRGNITAYFRTWNPDLAGKCLAAEEKAADENGKDDIIYWKLLYEIHPGLKGFYWKGRTFESLAAFGRDTLERLWNGDHSWFAWYGGLLSEKVLSEYVSMISPGNEKLVRAAAAIEDSFELEKINGTDRLRTYYLMAYILSGQKLLLLDGQQFRTVGELAGYMRTLLETSPKQFEALCHRLVDYEGNLDFQLETWLIALGKQEEIERWRASLQ